MGNSDRERVETGEQLGKRSWLVYLLVFSLALNLASLGTVAYLGRQAVHDSGRRPAGPPLTVKELCRSLPLQREQCQQLRSMMPEHQKQRQELRMALAREQRDLWELMKQGSSPWPAIQSKIKDISLLQTKMEEEAVQLSLQFQRHLQPEQRIIYLSLLERQLRPKREGGGGTYTPKAGRGRWSSTRKDMSSKD
jgi:Spy/CpxP family protein refolding chaperone|uniref:Periplasmic heavy metal sensor n=1 Tax=Desulfobacca acetoxidans TaxID=60893 RepID=A0A7V6A0R9_9BACT